MLNPPYVHSTFTLINMSKNWSNQARYPRFKNPSSSTTTNSNANFERMINHHGGVPYGSSGARSLFPAKLRQLLDDSEMEGNTHIVSWMPHGKAFRVHNPKEFAAKIVGRYFNHGQYRSFTRQVRKRRFN
jgi:hypothetical protein